jgi:hypothetical protein
MYEHKMINYLSKNDLSELEYLYAKLHWMLNTENEIFDTGRNFMIYKCEGNQDKVLW